MQPCQNKSQQKWAYAMIAGAILIVSGIFLFWQSLTAPFSFLFWISLDGTFVGLVLLFGGFGWYLVWIKRNSIRTLGIISLFISLMLAFSIPVGFFVQDHLYRLILLTEVADSPWEVEEMSLDVSISPEEEHITVIGEVRLILEECCSQSIVLSLPRESLAFDSVASDNHQVDIYRDGSLARIMLSEEYHAGESVNISFTYHNLVSRIDQAIVPFSDFVVEENFAYVVEPYPWYPTPFGNRSPGVLAEILITIPEDWMTISNGSLISSSISEGDVRQDIWHTDTPARLSFVAGPYEVARKQLDGRDYAVYTLNRDVQVGEASIAHLSKIVTILEAYYGPYPTAGYALVEVPSQYIRHSAESQVGYLISDPSLLFPGDQLGIALTSHEFSHGWWGEFLENVNPGNKMVNEGLAQYSAVLVIEQLEGREAMIDFLRFNRPEYVPHQSAQSYFTNILGTAQDTPLIDASHFLANTKGPWFYHMLRNRVGDEIFFGSLREVLDTYGGETASMHEIQAIFEKNTPDEKNIEVFFEQWLYRPGVPYLDYTWEINEEGGHTLEVNISQKGEIYDLYLEIFYQDDFGDHTEIAHITQAQETYYLPAEGEVKFVLLDPNHELLIQISESER